jgi:hypothetical protein
MMRNIVEVHFPALDRNLADSAIAIFYDLRNIEGIEKKPATRELLNWLRALTVDPDFRDGERLKREIPYLGILFKKSGDYQRSTATLMKKRFF